MENKDMPAFPATDNNTFYEPGLTKREYFAGVAMQGLLSHPDIYNDTTPLEVIARDAVAQSDALMAELSKPQP